MLPSDIQQLHGATPNDFLLGDLDVYVQDYDENYPVRFVGRTTHEKTITPNYEYAEWWDGMPQTLYRLDPTKIELSMKFGFAQLGDPVVWGFMLDAALDFSDPTTTVAYVGSNPSQAPDFHWWFIGELVDGRSFQFVIRRGRITTPEDIVTGSGDYAVGNVTVRAFKDDTICDEEQNLAYFCIENLDVPSGGFTDPCESEMPAPCDPS